MKIICAPEADMLIVSQSSRNQRKSLANFVPQVGLSIVDYARLQEIDHFYLDCQNFRDYYRDPYNKLPRPNIFKKHYGKCGKRFQDKTTEKLLQPSLWIQEQQPIIYPVKYSRGISNGGFQLGGQYSPASCIRYKH